MKKYSLGNCCKAVDVSYDTFKDWVQVRLSEEDIKSGNYRPGFIPEVHALYKKARLPEIRIDFKYLVPNKVRQGLLMRVSVYDKEEITTKVVLDDDGQVLYTLVTKYNKPVLPDTKLLIHLYKALGGT